MWRPVIQSPKDTSCWYWSKRCCWLNRTTRPLIEFTLGPLLEDHGIPLAVMGILVVFLALVLVVVFHFRASATCAGSDFAEDPPEQPNDSGRSMEDELPEETLVVIAAAVAEVVGPTASHRANPRVDARRSWMVTRRTHAAPSVAQDSTSSPPMSVYEYLSSKAGSSFTRRPRSPVSSRAT